MKNSVLSLCFLGLLASCAHQSQAPRALPSPTAKSVKLTVLHTNDHHGRFWKNNDGEYGLAARKTLIDGVRAEVKAAGGHVLLLDGGDVNMGVPESDTQDAEPDFKGMKLLGYDAMALGNHEFDKPFDVLQKQMQWAGFPMLAANIYKNGQRIAKPYEIFDRGGLKIAVLGLTTDDTPKMTANSGGLEFRKPAQEAAALMPQLKAQAHVVIAATHMGHYTDGKHGINAPGDVEMARAVKGFDLIVGGHSQNPVCMEAAGTVLTRNDTYTPGSACKPDQQNGAWIVQAHEWGKYVGRADFEYTGGQLKLVSYALLPVNLKRTVRGVDGKDSKQTYMPEIKEDAQILSLLQPFQDKGRAALDQIIGEADGVLDGDRSRIRSQPTNLGIFIATVMKEKTKSNLAIMNAGGVRDSLPAGKLSYKDILKVQPFGNMLCYVDLRGSELNVYLEAIAKITAGSGGYPQLSGLRLQRNQGKLEAAFVDGESINPKAMYRLALNHFSAAGGDGYPALNKHPNFVNTGYVDADVMREYLAKGKLLTQKFSPVQ